MWHPGCFPPWSHLPTQGVPRGVFPNCLKNPRSARKPRHPGTDAECPYPLRPSLPAGGKIGGIFVLAMIHQNHDFWSIPPLPPATETPVKLAYCDRQNPSLYCSHPSSGCGIRCLQDLCVLTTWKVSTDWKMPRNKFARLRFYQPWQLPDFPEYAKELTPPSSALFRGST